MRDGWLGDHRRLLAGLVSGGAVAALVATVAVVSGGYEAQRVDLDDGSVWVANGQQQAIGRANTEVLALDTVVPTDGTDLEVVQDASTLLLVDRTESTVEVVDEALATAGDSVPLPTGAEVLLAGGNAVVHVPSTGAVWVLPTADLDAFDPTAEPTRVFGADTLAVVDPDGTLFVYSADAREVYRVDAAGDGGVTAAPAELGEPGDEVSLSAAEGRWVLLNRDTATLSIEGRIIDLADELPDAGAAVLQRPGSGVDRVVVASPTALVSVATSGAETRTLVADEAGGIELGGTPAAPLVTAGCVYAAWSTGVAWRGCGADERALPLQGVPAAAARLGFASSGERVVLTDPRGGSAWAVQADGERIANWDDLIDAEEDEREVEENDEDTPPEFEQDQQLPVAVDDEFGARPGRATVLPVLLNDYDPNGDVLVVSAVTPIDEAVGRVDVVGDGQQLQLTLAPGAVGSVDLGYTIDDGRGGTASAAVRVAVRSPEENGAPAQVRQSRTLVARGAAATASVLGDWVDPDGDAFYLTSATASAPDTASYKPSGEVVFQEGGGPGELREVGLGVSDGRAEGVGDLLVTVEDVGEVDIIAESFPVPAYAGQEVTVAPLEHVRGGSAPIVLTSVPERAGSTIRPSLETGTFRFVSDQVRTHLISYVVSDGVDTASGTVRIDVQAPPDAGTAPITTPKTVFVRTLTSETVDIAASDIDPAGGVLLLQSVDAPAPAAGVRTEVIEQRALRVTLTGPLAAPVVLGYTVSNGLAQATGTVTVVEIPAPALRQPPVAVDDTVTVRVGDTVDIPVLANDEQPDGYPIELDAALVSPLPRASGLLFASGDVLRYLAPQRAGNFTAVYRVTSDDGQYADAAVRIAVREAVPETNAAPVPSPVVARVLAGETVRVRIPLTGIDPDGDSVQLLGQETGPEKGTVTEVGPDYLEYAAGDYSAGTDAFTYTVVDGLGARATGTVRIGIGPRLTTPRNPVAVPDEVRVRPGTTVSVQPLLNDSDPDGGVLRVTGAVPNSPDVTAEVVGDVVDITPPREPGEYGVVYEIENSFGGTDSDFIRVRVETDALPSRPVASDTVLALSDILDREEVTVDVLRNVFFADGDTRSLGLEVLAGYDERARVSAGKRIVVQVAERRQIIPFRVVHPEAPDVVAYAFIRVPGLADALPQLDRTVRTPSVVSEEPLTIDLDDYVVSAGREGVRLTDSTTVRATHANGDQLVVDDDTLRFTSADAYFGPASIAFEVTDGRTADDPDGRRATLVLPILVTPRENQPPVFSGGVVDFEPGQEKTLDLGRLTAYDDPDGRDELRYTAVGAPPAGFDYTITGSELRISADEGAPKGTRASLTIAVRDRTSEGQSGRISLGVTASTRPLASPAADSAIAARGRTTVVDVLANDEATNPFPGRRLRVLQVRGLDGRALPAGVTISPSADNSRLSVTVANDAAPGDVNLQYQVADATGDPDRYAFGAVRISVQDRPSAPVAPARADGGFEEGLLTLRLTAPLANNSPITGYTVVSAAGDYRYDCRTALRCVLPDLEPGRRYQFSVIATNAIGASDPSPASPAFAVDYIPRAPSQVSARATNANAAGAIEVTWSGVPDPLPGTAVTGYVVRVTGAGADIQVSADRDRRSVSIDDGRLTAGAQYVATVSARNRAEVLSEADWRRASSAPVTAVGAPSQVSGLTAVSINARGHIQVSWNPADPGGAPGVSYRVARIEDGASAPSCRSNPGFVAASPAVDERAVDGAQYRYVVYADNGLFCTPTVSGPVESRATPGAATATVDVVLRDQGRFDVRVTELGVVSGTPNRWEVQVNGDGVWRGADVGTWLTSGTDARVYGVPQQYVFRACRDSGSALCGVPSVPQTATPVDARAQVLSCTFGNTVLAQPRAYGGDAQYTYAYDYNFGGIVARDYDGSFDDPQVAPEASVVGGTEPGVRVKASVTIDGRTYTDPEYEQASCSG